MGGGDLSKERMGERDMGPAMASLQQPLSTQPLSQNQNQNQIQNQNQQSSSAANSSTNSVRGANFGKMEPADEFPVGMRVLVVDDDPMCLILLERMLRICSYQVTTCGRAAKALELLREDKDRFDLIISDVYMPDMDGFKLLELVGLEMDLPVIMMSADGEISAVMKGITHGACDYLLKPVRLEELRNIWQHVVRKKRLESKEVEHSTSLDEGGDRQKRVGVEDADYTSSATDTTDGNWKLSKRKKESKEEEEDNEQENDDPSTLKKPRVVWSVELHQQFVSAVNQLGIDKAVPKRILELMSVHGLTRENVASHLQKYRLYLKRLSGVTSQQNNMNAPFGGPDAFPMISADLAGGLPFATFHSNILGRMPSNGMLQNCLDPSIMGQFGTHDSPRPRVNGALLNTSGLLPSLPGGIHLDSVPQSHHLSALNQLDDLPSLKALHQLNQSSGIGMGTLGAPIPSANNEALLMHQLFQPRASPHGATSSLNLSQSTSGLGTPHLLSSDINLGNAGPLPNLGGNIGTGVGLSAMGGPVGRGLSPSLGGTAASLSSSLGSLLPRAPIADQSLNLVNSTGGTFSVASSVQSPKPGGATGPPLTMNEGSSQQQSMRAPYNPLTHLNQALSPASTHNSRPMWSGTAGNLGLGDLGQSISPGLSPRFSTQSPNSGGGFATPSHHGQQGHGAYMGQTASYPVRLALEGGMGRPSLNGGHSSREQLDMEQKLMKDDRTRESLISAKLEGGLLHPDAPEEFFGYYFKQPHEGMGGFSECDLPEDGYNPLDNLYVK